MQTTAQNASCDALTGDDTQRQEGWDAPLRRKEPGPPRAGVRVIDPTDRACVVHALN